MPMSQQPAQMENPYDTFYFLDGSTAPPKPKNKTPRGSIKAFSTLKVRNVGNTRVYVMRSPNGGSMAEP